MLCVMTSGMEAVQWTVDLCLLMSHFSLLCKCLGILDNLSDHCPFSSVLNLTYHRNIYSEVVSNVSIAPKKLK